MASSSLISSPLLSSPLSFIATDSNRSIHLLTFAPHSSLFPSLTKPNRTCGPSALRVRAQLGIWELNRSPERPKWRTRVSFFPSFLAKKSRSRDEIKQELLDAIAPLDRGAEATPEDQERIDQVAGELEAVNPTKEPLKSNLLNGKWELLYTTSTSILRTQRPKLLRPNGKIYQAINTDTLRAQNMETWPFFNQATADLIPLDSKRVAVKFDTFKIAGLIPIKAPDRPAEDRGQVEITYLDEEIRISRGNRGNLFILKMVDPSYRIPV